MSKVVFTTIQHINGLGEAKWVNGDNDSYEKTKQMAADDGGIRLIGRMDKYGRVQLCYASNQGSEWTEVNERHVKLASFLNEKLETQKNAEVLRVFFNEIDDAVAMDAAQQLIAVECGTNVTKQPWGLLHKAVLAVQSSLKSLGVPCGDWTFIPMFNSFKTTT